MIKLLIAISILFTVNLTFAGVQPSIPNSLPTSTHQVKNSDLPQITSIENPKTPPSSGPHAGVLSKPDSRSAENQQPDKYPSDWWLIGLTAVLALATYRLVVQTRRLVDETARTSNRQAAETQDALKISRDAANATAEQAKTATDALQRSNRAWVGLMGSVEMVTSLSFDKNEAHCKIRLTIKNVGASPALNTCLMCKLIVGPYPYPDPRSYVAVVDQGFLKIATDKMGITVIPGDPMQWSTVEVREPMPEKLSEVSVWLNGYFGYRDEFGTIHSSSFFFSFATPDGDRKISPNKSVKGRFEPFGVGWTNT